MGFVFGIVTRRFPSKSCWRFDLISFDCILACSRASCEMELWGSFLSICRDCCKWTGNKGRARWESVINAWAIIETYQRPSEIPGLQLLRNWSNSIKVAPLKKAIITHFRHSTTLPTDNFFYRANHYRLSVLLTQQQHQRNKLLHTECNPEWFNWASLPRLLPILFLKTPCDWIIKTLSKKRSINSCLEHENQSKHTPLRP